MNFLRQVGPIDEPTLVRRELPGGLTLLAEPVGHVPSLALGIWIRSGSRHEEPSRAGVAHLIEHMLFKGTKRRSAYQIAKAIEQLGGQIDAFTTKEATCYHARVFSGHQQQTVELLGDILSGPSFRKDELEKERAVVEEEIHSYDDAPEEYVFDCATDEIWAGHPLGHSILGTEETLRRLGSRELKEFHRAHYTRPNILVAAAGNFDVDRLAADLTRHFSMSSTPAPNGSRRIPRYRRHEKHLEKEITQTSVCLMRRGPSSKDPRRHAQYLLHTILGVGVSSRLVQKIREDKGLAYTVYTYMDSMLDTGLFSIYFAVDPAEAKRAVKLVCRELERVRDRGVKKWELDSAKAQILTSLFLGQESMFERMSRIAYNDIYYRRPVSMAKAIEAISAVTQAEVKGAAEQLLDSEQFSLVTVGPKGHARPDLTELRF